MNLIQELLGLKKPTEDLAEARTSEDLADMIEKFCSMNQIHHFEGGRGVNNFEKIAKALNPDYRNIDTFLEDNPGCLQAMIEWIGNQNIEEWKESMLAEVGDEGDEDMNESVTESAPVMIISVRSGLNADGFTVSIVNGKNSKVFNNRYDYGYNASHSKEGARYAETDHENGIKFKWNRVPELRPYTTDIIKDLMKKHNIKRDNIQIKVGTSVFSGEKLPEGDAKRFSDKYLDF